MGLNFMKIFSIEKNRNLIRNFFLNFEKKKKITVVEENKLNSSNLLITTRISDTFMLFYPFQSSSTNFL